MVNEGEVNYERTIIISLNKTSFGQNTERMK